GPPPPSGAHQADAIVRRQPEGSGGQAVRETPMRGARSSSIIAIMEQRGGEWNRMTFEALAAAQQIARETGDTASAAVVGNGLDGLAGELAARQLEKVYAVERPLLAEYTADGYSAALAQFVAQAKPALVLFPHTYQVRAFLPKLATGLGKVPVSDAVSHPIESGQAGM